MLFQYSLLQKELINKLSGFNLVRNSLSVVSIFIVTERVDQQVEWIQFGLEQFELFQYSLLYCCEPDLFQFVCSGTR